ncbi:MAG TPA: TIGR03557 family F420-dependent LLM class oxidoreductase [Acidimicrobiales bacterium]|nr:TIGR03557 family F420-dependent LLM class oxidoreductase [Acidimicrobiales bacterium]
MTTFGYTLMTEEHGPRALVANARRAEELGFDFLVSSDHYHPWVPEQQHSPYAWSVLGAVAAVTERIGLMTMVTCPIVRYHPAVVAQKAATLGVLSEGRFTLGLGAGERLNEHVVGRGWPSASVRHEMLAEAIEVIRLLWEGGYRSHRGAHFTVEDARVFDLPDTPVPIAVAASGPRSARLAGRLGDGIVATEPDAALVDAFRQVHGAPGATWNQIPMCWGEDPDEALARAHATFRWSALGWKVQAELPNPVNFDAAAAQVRPEDLRPTIPTGPDPQPYVDAVAKVADAGYDNIALLQIGDDQGGFLRFWERELAPALRARA